MEIEKILVKKKEFQNLILDFLENDEDDLDELKEYIIDTNISKNKQELNDILHEILKIVDNHRRESHFFDKIIQILLILLPSIKSYFTSQDIYEIFKTSSLMILLLIQHQIIILDKKIVKNIISNDQNYTSLQQNKMSNKYFFYSYIKSYIIESEHKQIEDEISEKFDVDLKTFQQLCQQGENDSYICSLIREDNIDDFIILVNRTNCSLNLKINSSVYETNPFLLKKNPTLIEYATFYGSIQIFKYLQLNNVNITASIWEYAIHGRNPELIHIIEEIDYIKIHDYSFLLDEAIKCHHNSITYYFKENYLNGTDNIDFYNVFKNYNYAFFPSDYKTFLTKVAKYSKMVDISILKVFLSIKEISIPSSDKIINNFFFKVLNSLSEIKLPSSVTSIGSKAFLDCSSLKVINIPNSVTYIGENAFNGCSSLINITIPSLITSINEATFFKCSHLKEVSFESLSSLNSIKCDAFCGC